LCDNLYTVKSLSPSSIRGLLALSLILPAFHPSSLLAGHVWYRARDGVTTGYAEDADWGHLQSAITAAQVGSAVTGMVKISGNITRTDSTWPEAAASPW
jgi:hypothetical protein